MPYSIHVFRVNDVWVVKKEGERGRAFDTRREAFASAVSRAKKAKRAQVVVHRNDGRIQESRRYNLPKIPDYPQRGGIDPEKIEAAVGRLIMGRLLAEPLPRRAQSTSR